MTAPANQSALALLNDMLRQWGLESLSGSVLQMLTDGDPPELVPLKLQETAEYKQRFKANDARRRAGMAVLSPAEYVANEGQYRDRLRQAGMPAGFYDSRDDFHQWLEKDVSPTELGDRISVAASTFVNAPVEYRDQWYNLYGLGAGHAIAAILDPDRAMPLLERQARSVSIAGESTRAFRDGSQMGVERAEQLAAAGVDAQDARKGFTEVASRATNDQFLGRLAGTDLSRENLEDEVLLDDELVKAQRRKVLDAEDARFRQNYLGTQAGGLGNDRTY